MLKVYRKMLRASYQTFGFFSRDFLITLALPLLLLFNHVCLALDNVFFRKYQSVEIKQPIFIIGHPRSGTTFFHRLMLKTEEFVSFKAWELTFPSLTARKILAPIINNRIANGKHVLFPPETGHYTRLDTVEEEEQLFTHLLDTQFNSIIFSLGFLKGDFDELCFNDLQKHRKTSMNHFKRCLQRQIYYTGKTQIMARCNFSAMRIKTLAEAFPDAKFIYLYRNPLATIPSHLSLNYHVFDYKWGLENIGKEALQGYFNRRYRYNVNLYKYFNQVKNNSDVLKDKIIEVYYDDLLSDFSQVMARVKAFMGIEFSEALQLEIEKQAEKQKSYKRKHKNYDLEKFGLTEVQIRKDLDFMFEKIAKLN
jgi:hypothetical protein